MYHFTISNNLPSILKYGLSPRIGAAYKYDDHIDEKAPAIFLNRSSSNCEWGALGMVDNYDDPAYLGVTEAISKRWTDENIVILCIDTQGLDLQVDPGWNGKDDEEPLAYYTKQVIQPERIVSWYRPYAQKDATCPECKRISNNAVGVVIHDSIPMTDKQHSALYGEMHEDDDITHIIYKCCCYFELPVAEEEIIKKSRWSRVLSKGLKTGWVRN